MQLAGTAAALLWQRGHLAERTALACGHSAALHSPPSPAALAARLPPDLPQPLDFEVKQAVFVKSSSETKELPTPVTPGKHWADPISRYEIRPPIASNEYMQCPSGQLPWAPLEQRFTLSWAHVHALAPMAASCTRDDAITPCHSPMHRVCIHWPDQVREEQRCAAPDRQP